eukprot:10255008-Alexandrium_andersonii.AAC.1
MFKEWERRHCKEDATRACSRLPPRPLRGRWAAIDGAEDHLLRLAGRDQTPGVFAEAPPVGV